MDERSEGTPERPEDDAERRGERTVEERREGPPGYDMAEEEVYEPEPPAEDGGD